MCTAVSITADNHYFGRNLDWTSSFDEKIVVVPRNFLFSLRHEGHLSRHYAIIGGAVVESGYPLFFDAANEKGLAAAGLNFPQNSQYNACIENRKNIASFEVIPWVLGQCESVSEAKVLLLKVNITDTHFSDNYSPSPLHWIFSDKTGSITLEQTSEGLRIYDNPVGVLTNNPPFNYHLQNITNYMMLSNSEPRNNFSKSLNLEPFSFGMGAIGLPGDFSSVGRFVRAAFVKENSFFVESEENKVSQLFHIMASVSQPRGVNLVNNETEYTIYTSCINTDKGIYYKRTYYSNEIFKADINDYDLNDTQISVFAIKNN